MHLDLCRYRCTNVLVRVTSYEEGENLHTAAFIYDWVYAYDIVYFVVICSKYFFDKCCFESTFCKF